jgi:hypothetical protein
MAGMERRGGKKLLHRKEQLRLVVLSLAVAGGLVGRSPAAAPPKAIIWMLGDDYGYANVGFAHGPNPGNPEARTPTMDALVKEGVLLDRHCASDARLRS